MIRHRLRPYLFLTVAGIAWGLGFPLGKAALVAMPVPAMVTFRFVIASLILIPLVLRAPRATVTRRQWFWLVVTGVLYVPVQFLVQFEGLARTSVTHASLIVAVIPALLAIAGAILPPHRRVQWLPVSGSVAGAVLIVTHASGGAGLAGDLLVLLSFTVSVAWVLCTERFLGGIGPIVAAGYSIWFGTAALAAIEAAWHGAQLVQPYPQHAWFAVAATGVLSTAVATVAWNAGIQAVPSADAGVFINLEPLVGAFCGIAMFGEPFSAQVVAGGLMIVASAVAIARGGTARKPVRPPRPRVDMPFPHATCDGAPLDARARLPLPAIRWDV